MDPDTTSAPDPAVPEPVADAADAPEGIFGIIDWLTNYDLFGGNTLFNLVGFFLAIFAAMIIAKIVQMVFRGFLKRMAEKSKTKLDDILLTTFERPIYWILLVGGFQLSTMALVLPETIATFVFNVVTVIITMFVAWSATNLVVALREAYIDPLTEKSETKLDDQIVPIAQSAVKVTIWALAVLIVVSNLGYDILSLLTGLGIGGLALAMAAQDTLSNVFGSVTIFADRPFQVDDTVNMGGYTGKVTEVGMRTCRLKTLDGTVVTIPNGSLVGGAIENLSMREARKHNIVIGLVYETPSSEVKRAIAGFQEILDAHEKIREDFAVRLLNFGDSALEVQVLFWVDPPGDYFDVVGEINLAILEKCTEEGWDMAFPSMTIYRGDGEAAA